MYTHQNELPESYDRMVHKFKQTVQKKYGVYLEVRPIKERFPQTYGSKLDELLDFFKSLEVRDKMGHDFLSPSRYKDLVYLRMVFAKVAYEMRFTYVMIADKINRHHTSVIYLVKTANDLIETHDNFEEYFLYIIRLLNQHSTLKNERVIQSYLPARLVA